MWSLAKAEEQTGPVPGSTRPPGTAIVHTKKRHAELGTALSWPGDTDNGLRGHHCSHILTSSRHHDPPPPADATDITGNF